MSDDGFGYLWIREQALQRLDRALRLVQAHLVHGDRSSVHFAHPFDLERQPSTLDNVADADLTQGRTSNIVRRRIIRYRTECPTCDLNWEP